MRAAGSHAEHRSAPRSTARQRVCGAHGIGCLSWQTACLCDLGSGLRLRLRVALPRPAQIVLFKLLKTPSKRTEVVKCVWAWGVSGHGRFEGRGRVQ